jgi:hypothetical protein
VVTALAAFVVNLSVESISGFKFWAVLSIMEHGDVVASFLAYVAVNAGARSSQLRAMCGAPLGHTASGTHGRSAHSTARSQSTVNATRRECLRDGSVRAAAVEQSPSLVLGVGACAAASRGLQSVTAPPAPLSLCPPQPWSRPVWRSRCMWGRRPRARASLR